MVRRLGTEGITIVDTRAGIGWKLYAPTPDFAAGHVPLALPYDFSRLWGEGSSWPLIDDARKELAKLGPRAGSSVSLDDLFVVYGTDRSDPRPALAYTVLRLLGLRVRVYTGGWAGWSADRSDPIVKIISAQDLHDLEEQAGSRRKSLSYPRLPIFDLRELRDWEVGHVPGAFPLSAVEFARFFGLVVEKYWPAADPARDPLIVYCYGPGCTRSRQGIAVAVKSGWRTIYWFRQGLAGWFQAGYQPERLASDQVPWAEEGGG